MNPEKTCENFLKRDDIFKALIQLLVAVRAEQNLDNKSKQFSKEGLLLLRRPLNGLSKDLENNNFTFVVKMWKRNR